MLRKWKETETETENEEENREEETIVPENWEEEEEESYNYNYNVVSRPIDVFLVDLLGGRVKKHCGLRSLLLIDCLDFVNSLLKKEFLEVGEDVLRERNKQSLKELERRASFLSSPPPDDFGEDVSRMFEENPHTRWRNRVRSVTRQRRKFFPSFIFRLSFSFRRFCRANEYVSGMFQEVQEGDNDAFNDLELFCISALNRFPTIYPEHYDLAPKENPDSVVKTYTDHGLYYYGGRMMVTLYAMLGLHRYNILNGTNLDLYDLCVITKCNIRFPSYYITFLAYNPSIDGFENISDSRKTNFHVRVNEMVLGGQLYVVCPIAIARSPSRLSNNKYATVRGEFTRGPTFPHWPSKSDVDDTKRFYVLNKEEWLYANDWIYLYLHLLIYSAFSTLGENELYRMEIVQVAVETLDLEVEPLKAKNVVVYIKYKDWKKVDRIAIVKRVFLEPTGWLSLWGRVLIHEEQQPSSSSLSPKW